MGHSPGSEKISRGVTTEITGIMEPVQIRTSADEGDYSTSLTSQVYDNNEVYETTQHKPEESTISDALEYCTESGDTQRILYRMKTEVKKGYPSPSKVEFRLYKPKTRKGRRIKKPPSSISRKVYISTKSVQTQSRTPVKEEPAEGNSFFNRLRTSLSKMAQSTISEPIEQESKDCDTYSHRMDIYYFDHGNFDYFRTTDCPPHILSEMLANQTTHYATRFWAEIFGSLHIGMTFFVSFFMQAYRFVLYSIVRPIIVGLLQMTSDYFVKPILTIIFNGLLQPPFVLLFNIFSSIRDMMEPIAATIAHFLKPLVDLFKAIRLVDVNMKGADVGKVDEVV